MDNGLVIDITANQFKYCAGFDEEVHIGEENSFYKGLDNKHYQSNYDITRSIRLWNDYKRIIDRIQ